MSEPDETIEEYLTRRLQEALNARIDKVTDELINGPISDETMALLFTDDITDPPPPS